MWWMAYKTIIKQKTIDKKMRVIIILIITYVFVIGIYSNRRNIERATESELCKLERESIELAEKEAEIRREYNDLKQEYQRGKEAFIEEFKSLHRKSLYMQQYNIKAHETIPLD